jgi:hypothetical protein
VVLSNRDLQPFDIASIFHDVALGLVDIHSVSTPSIPQLSHGDLSLDNIMVTDRNEAVIIDFGAAKMGRDSTLSRELFGKLGYFSPEQLLGPADGPPADVWQFGVALVRVAAGHMPFGLGPASTLRVLDDVPNLNGLPAGLAETVLACLVKDPQRRATAQEIANMLGRRMFHRAGLSNRVVPALSPVVAIGFAVGEDGILERRVKVQSSTFDNLGHWPAGSPGLAIGDLFPLFPGVEAYNQSRPRRQVVASPTRCPCCGTTVVTTVGNWRTAHRPGLHVRDVVEPWFCPAGYACKDQLGLTLMGFRIFTHMKALVGWAGAEAEAAGLTPADILAGAAKDLVLPPEALAREPGRLQRLDDERMAYVERVKRGDALSLLMALGLPGSSPDWGRSRPTLQDLQTDDPATALPDVAEWLREPLRDWWQERSDAVQASVRAVLSA